MRSLRFGSILSIALATSGLPAKALAQTADSLAGLRQALGRTTPLSQVRIELRGGQRLIGAFHPRPDSLELGGPARASTAVAFDDVDSLWRQHRATGQGALTGAGLSVVSGALLGLFFAAGGCMEGGCDHGEANQIVVGGAVIVGLVGAGVGALVGSAFPHWGLAWHRKHSRADRSRPPMGPVVIGLPGDPTTSPALPSAVQVGNVTALLSGGDQTGAGLSGAGFGGSIGLQLRHGLLGFGPEVQVMKGSASSLTTLTALGRIDLSARPSSRGGVPYLIFGLGWDHRASVSDELSRTLGLGYTANGRTRVELRWSHEGGAIGSSLLTVGIGRVWSW